MASFVAKLDILSPEQRADLFKAVQQIPAATVSELQRVLRSGTKGFGTGANGDQDVQE